MGRERCLLAATRARLSPTRRSLRNQTIAGRSKKPACAERKFNLKRSDMRSPNHAERERQQAREGAEAVEVIMWLTMRGALSENATRVHRNYYAPMATGMGLIAFEEAG